MIRYRKKDAAFTLIELSIVLVIIGLLTGAIVAGQSLIRQSKLNSVAADAQRYAQAALNFQQKYNALPGDFATASSYWTGVSNGDGNGQVGATTEAFQFWLHLAKAGLIEGSYTGSAGGAGSSDHVIGSNCPASRLDGAAFGVNYAGIKSSDTNFYDNNFGHVFIFGAYNSNNFPASALIAGAEAYSMDKKFDDGLPVSGTIQSWKTTGYNSGCTTGATSSATYVTSGSGTQCSLIFVTGF